MQLSIIHLSDIHIRNSEDHILNKAVEIAKACASSIKQNAKVVVVVSGDIAYSGEEEQYNLAKKFFKQIETYLVEKCNSTVEFVFSPGNHDCDFTKSNSIRTTLIDSINYDNVDIEYTNTVTKIQDNYFNFVCDYTGSGTDRMISKKEIEIERKRALFVSLNTAWMSQLHEQPGKLVMPLCSFPEIDTTKYDAVIYTFHHPLNWLNPDYKTAFLNHLRRNTDIILLGHEHVKENYTQVGSEYELIFNHGKELQNSDNDDSGFSIITFDNSLGSYEVRDYLWDKNCLYKRAKEVVFTFERNKASRSACSVNKTFEKFLNDYGLDVRHFAKDEVILNDLYLWPDLNKSDYKNEKGGSIRITENVEKELLGDSLSLVVGESLSGKSSLGKQLFCSSIINGKCPIFVDGQRFTTSSENSIERVIEAAYKEQYSAEYAEEFRQMAKEDKVIIVDNFDSVANKNNRRNMIIDCLSNTFSSVVVLMSSSIEITSILKSEKINSLDKLYYYEIRSFGNKKRKDFIKKWYRLNNYSDTDEIIEEKIEQSKLVVDQFLGNGASFIPASPLVLVSILQNKDAFTPSVHMSKYGYLYESIISQSLASIEEYNSQPGLRNLDTEMLSELAFSALCEKTTFVARNEVKKIANLLEHEKLLPEINVDSFIDRMERARIFSIDRSLGEVYKFNYPYILYYFSAKYIAKHIKDEKVQELMEHMSCNLHNETYGNVVTFVCHFDSEQSVIDDVLLNAYETLDSFIEFDYTKDNPIFDEIKNAVAAFIPQKIDSNDCVESNREKELQKMDRLGINDGGVSGGEDYIDESVSEEEKNMASITAALKTIEVLGQILQNYPADISGKNKVQMIDEMHKLGGRSVAAIIETMGYLENDLIDYIYELSIKKKPGLLKSEVESRVKGFINVIIAGMARLMIHQVAKSLNSDLLLPSVEETYRDTEDISAQLLMADLKLNCLNEVNYDEVKQLREALKKRGEVFAMGILDSIIGRYLNYNKCDYKLRSRLCNLCGFPIIPQIESAN